VCTEIASVPTTISQPGLYCLKRDLSYGRISGAAVTVEANNVTVDLNGFRLGGAAAGTATFAAGIYATDRRNITIRNGTIRAFRNNVVLTGEGDGSSSSGHIIENLRIEGARRIGINVSGWRSIIRDNVVIGTVDVGTDAAFGILLNVGNGSTITGNMVSGVTSGGIASGIKLLASEAVTVDGNRIFDVTGTPSIAIEAFSGLRPIVRDNVAVNAVTGTTGIELGGSTRGCLDNVVVNFATSVSGCDLDERNRNF
jgi:hypothetical protein